MTKLDDASWHHSGDDFPEELPEECGATHIGFFIRWAIDRGFVSAFLGEGVGAPLDAVRSGVLSARTFVLEQCDGKLLSEMLKPEIANFSESYYPKKYLSDYHALLGARLESDYLVEESPENYSKVTSMLDAALQKSRTRRWWNPW